MKTLNILALAIIALAACTNEAPPDDLGSDTPGPTDGPAAVCTKYADDTVAVAGLNEALGESAATQLAVTFYNQGSLRTIDGKECTPIAGTTQPTSIGWMTCFEAYDCGCEMWLGYYEGDGGANPEAWYLIHDPREHAGSCPAFDGFYKMGPPWIGPSPDGHEAQPPASDPCGACLDGCQGLSSCCTGSGCLCQGSCAPSSCSAPATMCCGPYGDCFCTPNCPY
jgi:hypothetical protein